MIQKKTAAAAVSQHKLPWPDCFYDESNPDKRRIMLEERLGAYEAVASSNANSIAISDAVSKEIPAISAEEHEKDLFRQKLFDRRYTTEKQGRQEVYIDRFARSWMMMAVSARQGIGLFNRKALIKEWHGYLKDFCIEDFSCANETEHQLLITEWRAFLNQQINCCVSDKSYGSLAFGFFRMKDDAISGKIADEMQLVTEDFPEKLGLKEQFAMLHLIAGEVYNDSSAV